MHNFSHLHVRDPFVMVFVNSLYFMDFKELYSTKFGSECQVHQVFFKSYMVFMPMPLNIVTFPWEEET